MLNHRIQFSLAVTYLLLVSACSTPPRSPEQVQAPGKQTQSAGESGQISEPTEIGILAAKPKTVLLDHKYFVIHYDPAFRLARFVKYTLHAEQLKNTKAKWRDRFMADPLLKKMGLPYVVPKEYSKSGYDQGHLAPSADFAFSQQANDLTFVMSNMAPQKPGLNRDAWRRLEDKVRKWACGEEKITVITGPVLEKGLKTLKSGLPIPEQFFKLVIDETPPKKAIAFLYNQTDKGDLLEKRTVEIRLLAMKIQEDFSGEIPPEERGILRAKPALAEWRERDCGE